MSEHWSRGYFLIEFDDLGVDGYVIVRGFIHPNGEIGVHRSVGGRLDRWNATHLRTGWGISYALPGLGLTLRYVQEIAPLLPWSKIKATHAWKRKFGMAALPIWRRYEQAWEDPSIRSAFHLRPNERTKAALAASAPPPTAEQGAEDGAQR